MAARTELWGDETSKAVENFQISGQTIPAPVIHWLGRLKAAAARANAALGQLDSDLAGEAAHPDDHVNMGQS